jgi:hypothetical protein
MSYIYWIFDTLWEFWQYLKPSRRVYIAGIKKFDRYVLTKMIPESLPLDNGWEQLTQPMPFAEAEQRIQHFKLIKIVES